MRIVHHMKLAHKFLIRGLVVQAVAQMDQVTQQNAALVEEIAAAADSLHRQSQQLLETVSVFKL